MRNNCSVIALSNLSATGRSFAEKTYPSAPSGSVKTHLPSSPFAAVPTCFLSKSSYFAKSCAPSASFNFENTALQSRSVVTPVVILSPNVTVKPSKLTASVKSSLPCMNTPISYSAT